MKKANALIIAVLLLLSVNFTGCGKEKVTVTLAVSANDIFDYKSAALEYNKTGNEVIKITESKDIYKADIFEFGIAELESAKNYCADLRDLSAYDSLYNSKYAINDEGYIYGLPACLDYAVLLYNKNIIKNIGDKDLSDFSSLKSTVNDIYTQKEKLGVQNIFVLGTENKEYYTNALLGTVIYFELETSDDYTFAPNAALNASRLALRYGENMKELIDLFKVSSGTVSTAEEAISMLKENKTAFCAIMSYKADFTDLEKTAGIIPLYMGVDGEEVQGITTLTNTFLGINKNCEEETRSAAEKFLEWLLSGNGEKYIKNINAIVPYKSAENNQNAIKKQISEHLQKKDTFPVISVSNAFTSGFSNEAASYILDYINNKSDWDTTEKLIKGAWEKDRN